MIDYMDHLSRIREILRDFEIKSVAQNNEGLINDVFIVNDAFVFRFAKKSSNASGFEAEAEILNQIRPHVSVRIPDPFYVSEDAMAYHLLEGEALTCLKFQSLKEPNRQILCDQISDFLESLRRVSIDKIRPTPVPCTKEDWKRIKVEVEARVYPMLLQHQLEWANSLFDEMFKDDSSFAYAPALVHGDLAPCHLLFDPARFQLSAILDFGVSGAGDPALDLGSLLYVYGESLVNRICSNISASDAEVKRARFYAQAIELRWTLSGIVTGHPLWFVAHLAGARDLRS